MAVENLNRQVHEHQLKAQAYAEAQNKRLQEFSEQLRKQQQDLVKNMVSMAVAAASFLGPDIQTFMDGYNLLKKGSYLAAAGLFAWGVFEITPWGKVAKIFKSLSKVTKGIPEIRGHTKTLRNPSQIDQMKKDMLGGNYEFDSPRGIISGVEDSKGVIHLGEGQHRMNAAIEIFEETGDASHINRLIDSARKGVGGRSFLPKGKPDWKSRKLQRRN